MAPPRAGISFLLMHPLAVQVPASTSNLGAGFDCLGLALDLWLEARLAPGDGTTLYSGTLAALDPERDMLRASLGSAMPKETALAVHSEIPVGKGLGSSAAARVAGFALKRLVERGSLDRDAVFRDATLAEGHPDNAGAAVYGGLFLATTRPRHFGLSPQLAIALAIPDQSIDTHEARTRLPRDIPRDVAVAQAARTAALVLGLTTGTPELVTFGMEDLIAVPKRRELIPGFARAVEAGRAAGAYGVTISGAGSGLIAITPAGAAAGAAAAMAEALIRAGNPATPITPETSETGLREA